MSPKTKLLFVAAATIHFFPPTSQAAAIFWDGGTSNIAANGDAVSQGGTGTWDGTIKNWDAGSGKAHIAWNKRFSAVFGGTSGTVTTGAALTVVGMTFSSDGYLITGTVSNPITLKSAGITANGNTTINAPLTLSIAQSWTTASGKLLTVGGTVANSNLLTIAGVGNTSVSGLISGSGGLTKTGTGLLTLTGLNTYSGVTTLGGGILNVGSVSTPGTSGPLGNSSSILMTGGTLQYSAVNAADYSSRFSTAGSQLWKIDTNNRDVTFVTALAGTGSSLTKSGTGTLTLSGASNTFTGGTTISAGTLSVSGTLADTGAVTVNGGTYTAAVNDTIGALSLTSGTISGAGTLSASSYAVQSGSISNVLADSGALAKTTAGTVILSGASTYTGGTTISAGTLNVTGTLANSGAVTVSGGTYTVGQNDTIGALTLTSGGINGSSTLTAASYAVASGTVSASLGGTGVGLTKTGTGIVTLSNTNSYTGATAINAGTLVVDGSLNAGSAVSLAGGATLTGIGTVAGTVTVANSPTATIMAGNGVSGTLTLGSLSFAGAGTIQIGTLSNYTTNSALNVTGALTLNGAAGAVKLELPAGAVSAGTYHLITNSLTTLTGFAVTGTSLGARQTSQLVNTAGKIDYIVTGANPYWTGALGSVWSTATLAAPKNWALSETVTTDFLTNDAVIFDDRATSTTVSIASNVSPNVVSFTNATKNYVLQGAAGIASGSLTKSGAGILTITNANTYAGGTTLYSGVLRVGNNGALGSGYLFLTSGNLSSDSTTARTLANNVSVEGNLTLGDAVNTGALTLGGTVDLGGVARQLDTPSNVTLSGSISNGGLIKNGSGTLTLSGSNTYLGGVVLNAGAVAINSATSLGDSSGSLTFAGNSSLIFNASFTGNRGYAINSGATDTIDTNGFNFTQIGVISSEGSLNKAGAGTLTIGGANIHTGTTSVSTGVLALSGGAAIIDTGAITIANVAGATLQLDASETIGSLAGGGITGGLVNLQANTLTVGNATDTTYAGAINGTGSVIKTGTGTLTLSGTSTFSGVTTINSGTLKIATGAALGAVPGSATVGKIVLAGGTLATTANFTLNANRGVTTGGTIDVAALTTLTYGGIAAGTGSLTKTGAGTLTLSGINTYTGATVVSRGNLEVNGSLVAASTVSVAVDAILSGSGTINGAVTAADGAIIRAGNGVTGSLSFASGLAFSGDGSIQIGTLSGYLTNPALSIAGSLTTISGASIVFNLPTALLTNGTYHLASHGNNINVTDFLPFSVSGPVVGARQSATLTNNNGMIDYVVTGDTPSWTGASGSAWSTAASNWKLITAGTATAFQAGDALLFDDSATGTTTVDIAADVNPVEMSFNNASKAYVIQGAAGITTGILVKSGAGTLTITNSNSYNDGTILNAGVLQVGNNSALGTGQVALNGGTLSSDSTTARSLSNGMAIGADVTLGDATRNGALILSGAVELGAGVRQLTTASDVTLSGIIMNGGLTKTGAATLTFSGANSYAGNTTVTTGKLVVNGSLANSAVTVGSGGTLGGSGSIGGATLVQSGGIHAPGNSPGVQSFTDLTYADGSIFSWEIDRTQTQTRGTGYDGVNVSGTLAGLDGADGNTTTDAIFRIVVGDSDFSNAFWNTPKSWTDIFTAADGTTTKSNWAAIFGRGFQFYNTGGSAVSAPSAGGFTLTGNTLSWSGVPEPSSVLVGLLLGAGLLSRRRVPPIDLHNRK